MSGMRFPSGRAGSSGSAPLAASLRTLGYAHFALLQPVPLAEIARARRSADRSGAGPEPAVVPDPANAVPEPAETAENVDPTVVAGAAETPDRSAVERPAAGAAERAAPPADPVAAADPAVQRLRRVVDPALLQAVARLDAAAPPPVPPDVDPESSSDAASAGDPDAEGAGVDVRVDDGSTVDSPRSGRSARALLQDIRFLDE